MTVISGNLYLNTRLIFNLLKSCGLMLNLVGFTLYLSMNHRCGFYAYNDCLRQCLLPSPLRFNHMALLGIFLSLGGICYGVGELMECTEALIVSIDVDETVCDEDDLSTMDLDENSHTGDQQVDEEIGDAIQPQDEQNEVNDKLQVVEHKIDKQKQQEHLDSRSDESDEEQPDDITLQMTNSSD
eukprot:CAMPEP_0202476998 /NCGR_PEP_ID=MMETSP1360-20130828/93717_1 /ASSEMBLY_ACC=CAM_ASM_000848 /TAXON_ID=515479 /ORGANISM="Licmophora paradoxa, Strain CCMP2313" /LENGTH=183 /DNA_ID=CAMNT_0049104229 /DNA_START=520 /DNA_END=1071 /DNA_ORIENTATION=-